jgi:hypothetical protein
LLKLDLVSVLTPEVARHLHALPVQVKQLAKPGERWVAYRWDAQGQVYQAVGGSRDEALERLDA